ncbi:hypothetical protein [Amorphus sp. 3PC139-8]|uniref:hypothetical protein n=1 Tax=Amorphus sp. 3PC139-8 TaxID=2735676 RepID=UPI00345C7DE1
MSRGDSVRGVDASGGAVFRKIRGRDGVFALACLVAIGLYVLLAAALLRQPPSLSSDDGFNFARALTRFSVLDFSPHFPGYPVFVGLGRLVRLVVPDPVSALQRTTTGVALALPWAAAWAAWSWTGARWAALAAFGLTLMQPILPALALSGLSDGTGLLFFVAFLALVLLAERNAGGSVAAGLSLGLSAWARPSYGLIQAGAWLVVVGRSPWRGSVILVGAIAVTMPVLAILLSIEGWGYFREGLRFFEGHTLVWGNTALSGSSDGAGWGAVLLERPAVLALLCLYAGAAVVSLAGERRRVAAPAIAAFAVSLVWMLAMQNPDNLRHLAPTLMLGGLLAATMPGRRAVRAAVIGLALVLNSWLAATTWDLADPRPAPLAAASVALQDRAPALLVTNQGVGFLRDRLNEVRVYDLFYPETAHAGVAASDLPAYRLTSTPIPACELAAVFPGRAFGEPALLLYRLNRAGPAPVCEWEPQ